MLVLTRKLREQIRVGENITIAVLEIKGSRVRLGIEAPREVRVVRNELGPKEDQAAAVASVADASAGEDDQGEAADESDTVSTTTARILAEPLRYGGLRDADVGSSAV